jgi:acyl dehydratase
MATEVTTVAQLKEHIGKEIAVGEWLQVTQERINAFADVTGDHQFIHVDPERAARTMFGGTIAHGFLTLSLLPALRQNSTGVKINLGHKVAVNYGLNKVRFIAPVRAGKRIRARTTLLSVEEVAPNAIQCVYNQTIEIEGESKPACVAETIGRWYF